MNHTTGPWHIWRDRNDNSLNVSGSRDDGYPFVCMIARDGDPRELGHDTKEADARLISAAPDLLNALAVLADVAEARGIPVDAARAAIAKAVAEPSTGIDR